MEENNVDAKEKHTRLKRHVKGEKQKVHSTTKLNLSAEKVQPIK